MWNYIFRTLSWCRLASIGCRGRACVSQLRNGMLIWGTSFPQRKIYVKAHKAAIYLHSLFKIVAQCLKPAVLSCSQISAQLIWNRWEKISRFEQAVCSSFTEIKDTSYNGSSICSCNMEQAIKDTFLLCEQVNLTHYIFQSWLSVLALITSFSLLSPSSLLLLLSVLSTKVTAIHCFWNSIKVANVYCHIEFMQTWLWRAMESLAQTFRYHDMCRLPNGKNRNDEENVRCEWSWIWH